jgi:hypothetical protein
MHPAWPPFEERQATPLYLGRQQYRRIVVLLDADVLPEVVLAAWGKAFLLGGLLTLDVVECFKYADDGPPADAARESSQFMGEVVPGWVVLSPHDGTGHRAARTGSAGHISDHAVFGNAHEVAASDTTTDVYRDLAPEDASERRRADALAAMVANAIGADLFITSRPYLHAVDWQIADGVTFADVDEALAILGLYLRAQGLHVVSRNPTGGGSFTMNRGLFFWVGARELLPSAWRWFAACVQHSAGSGTDRMLFLGQSVLQRVERAAQVRDEVHIGLNKPQNNDTAEESLSSLDVVLLLLMGSLDATARVAHAVLGLTTSPRNSGWQRSGWIQDVTAVAPALGALFQPGTDERHTLTILQLLRNSIHGEAMQAIGVGGTRRRERTLVSLPASNEPELRTAFLALGGLAAWGVEALIPGRLHFDPGVFLEELFPRIIAMLNRIMDETPIERMAHVALRPMDLLPPTGPQSGPFVEMNRQSIRWQLGL